MTACVLTQVRMHCFHHLLAIAHGPPHADYHGIIDKMEPDENVTRLNKDLAALDDVLQQALQARKFRCGYTLYLLSVHRESKKNINAHNFPECSPSLKILLPAN